MIFSACQRTPVFSKRKPGNWRIQGKKRKNRAKKEVIPTPNCHLFQIHGSILKPDPSCDCGQAPVVRITHGVFLFRVREDPFNCIRYRAEWKSFHHPGSSLQSRGSCTPRPSLRILLSRRPLACRHHFRPRRPQWASSPASRALRLLPAAAATSISSQSGLRAFSGTSSCWRWL